MQPDFDKMDGLVPAIIQDSYTQKVLMLGFMNKEAYEKTLTTGKVTFYSRTKQRLWTKGETSGNFLEVVSIKSDCDNDTLLIQAHPTGPVCHTGTDRHRHLLGRKKRARHHVLERIARLHRQAPRRNARKVIYHKPVQIWR